MRVITPGKLKFKDRHVCKACDALLEYELDDIKYEVTDAQAQAQQYNDDIVGDFYIICPECETRGVLKKLPENVKKAVRDK